MDVMDPITGQPLPPESFQRVLHVSRSVSVYNIPPLVSNKGYTAASWTTGNNKRQIFTARLRILETTIPSSASDPSTEKLRFDIVLEDPKDGQLFAAAPYSRPEVVQQALDSSRFFALRVQGDGGRKATLGISFEERNEAFDFSVTLQEVRRTLEFRDVLSFSKGKDTGVKEHEERDFSLKEGEMVVVDLGKRGRRKIEGDKMSDRSSHPQVGGENYMPFLPPPPSADEVRNRRRLSATFEPSNPNDHNIEESGFDDGEFGEFQ
ncbi:Adaptin ear-binding coat-associated protein 1 [Erysiphe neolycopersici]|uniref:Adaptin ear-binding coat-associated protein 1 n=1 Tax=Erysiphe neolycopersici TaxID=212602 RepID=A0A420H9W4_9PEZI|nr:Adaptin ear-binding coat-associated protein 1 [Erysiphe neolycopersici]